MDDWQSPEEIEAHLGPGGPVAAASHWMTLAAITGDVRAAWPLTDPTFRLVLGQAWIWANREHPIVVGHDFDVAAASIASLDFDHALWDQFAATQAREFTWKHQGFSLETWGVLSRPRLVPPDCELVLYAETGGEVITLTERTDVIAVQLLMRTTDEGWLTAGFSEHRLQPGWPPK